jgi:hypothetical protein
MYSPKKAGDWAYGFGQWAVDALTAKQQSDVVASPGLFGTFPWVDNKNKYAAILFTYNFKKKGGIKKIYHLRKY